MRSVVYECFERAGLTPPGRTRLRLGAAPLAFDRRLQPYAWLVGHPSQWISSLREEMS